MKREWKCRECGKTIGKRYSRHYCYDCAMTLAGYYKTDYGVWREKFEFGGSN